MQDEGTIYHVRSPVLDAFISEVQRTVAREPERTRTVKLLRPSFARLLGDQGWLPDDFTRPDPSGGMGEGVESHLSIRPT
jgi:hypothetical protein